LIKIALFHQFLDNIVGAEIIALTLAKEPNADLYTINIDAERIRNKTRANIKTN
jgi:hypothetical protein